MIEVQAIRGFVILSHSGEDGDRSFVRSLHYLGESDAGSSFARSIALAPNDAAFLLGEDHEKVKDARCYRADVYRRAIQVHQETAGELTAVLKDLGEV